MSIINGCKSVLAGVLPQVARRSSHAARFFGGLRETGRVAGGPFKGMVYSGEAIGSASDPKILGTYEAELTPTILKWSSIPFQTIIDVGAAEGYYAVGAALLWPRAKVIAFESNEQGRSLLSRMATLNGVDSRTEIKGHCDCDQLQQALQGKSSILLIMDVEGAERELLDPDKVPGLMQAYIMVEIHDDIDRGVGESVKSRLQPSHEVTEVWTKPRSILDFPQPRSFALRLYLLPYLKHHASELRAGPMCWFCCTPKSHDLG
jgi:hypothetical protein